LKNNLKFTAATLVLMGILIFSYLQIRGERNFNPFTHPLKSSTGTITLNELKKDKKIILMYFGFLSCPDICPTTLSSISSVFKVLPKEQLDHIEFLFIDLDPERDTMERMVKYSSHFHPKIKPVVMNLKELDLFTRFFGVVFMKMPLKSTMGYTIDHSTDIIVLSPEGKILRPITHGSPQVVIVDQLNKILNQKDIK
jgi:protein SCO1/2